MAFYTPTKPSCRSYLGTRIVFISAQTGHSVWYVTWVTRLHSFMPLQMLMLGIKNEIWAFALFRYNDKNKKKTHIKGSLYRYLFWSSILYSIYLDANSLFVKKAYVEMECTLTMEIYIVKYIWLLCRYFWEYFKLPTPSQTHKCITMRC